MEITFFSYSEINYWDELTGKSENSQNKIEYSWKMLIANLLAEWKLANLMLPTADILEPEESKNEGMKEGK